MVPAVEFKNCPIRVSIGVLGKKWMLLILRGIAFLKIDRFNQIRRSVISLTSRVLIMRLRELEESGLIEPIVVQEKPKLVRWTGVGFGPHGHMRCRDVPPRILSLYVGLKKWNFLLVVVWANF
jgi:DNA-binding HxlR family transcriptional regulator